MLFDKDRIFDFIHLELSQKCNLACPMCPREMLLANGFLDKSQISLQDLQKVFDPIIDRSGKFFLSGNYSDPMMHTNVKDISEYLLSGKETRLQIGTNGSLRTPDLYYEIGKMQRRDFENRKGEPTARRYSSIMFAIDGLEDTNHIYRVNANWDKVMENAKAFIDGGGFAEWKYIVFEHNEHQVEEAERLSKEMRFVQFTKVLSMRFVDWFGNVREDARDIDNKARKEERKGVINRSKEDVTQHIDRSDDTIKCDAIDKNGIFMTDKGLIMPCCWLGNEFGYNVQNGSIDITDHAFKHIVKMYPDWEKELNAIDHGLMNVLEHPIWQTLQDMWDLGGPHMCYRQCGLCLDDVKEKTEHHEDR